MVLLKDDTRMNVPSVPEGRKIRDTPVVSTTTARYIPNSLQSSPVSGIHLFQYLAFTFSSLFLKTDSYVFPLLLLQLLDLSDSARYVSDSGSLRVIHVEVPVNIHEKSTRRKQHLVLPRPGTTPCLGALSIIGQCSPYAHHLLV
jgi:hypothetical protein